LLLGTGNEVDLGLVLSAFLTLYPLMMI